jgi:lysophospholipid acyltransferase (LPLAT)-like uncharacterized protein
VTVEIKNILTTRLFMAFLYRFIRLYSLTFRLRIENEAEWLSYLNQGGTVVLCAWHQQFFSAIRYFQRYKGLNPSIMISKSRDGEMIAGVAERSGWHPVRGSSSRGGAEALRTIIERFGQSRLVGHIVDGPRGPAGKVKAGVIRLAHVADAVIIPFYTSADRAWYFNSWDNFFLPKPFSEVKISFDHMIRFKATEDDEEFELQRKQLEKTMTPRLQGRLAA